MSVVTVTRRVVAMTRVPWCLPWWVFVPRARWWAMRYGLRYDGMMRFGVLREKTPWALRIFTPRGKQLCRYVSPTFSSFLEPHRAVEAD